MRTPFALSNETPRPVPASQSLAAIVGGWQSDTVAGTAARSDCSWSPQGTAVICEQTITSNQGERHVVNVYTTEAGSGRHYYYGIPQPGESALPTALEIKDRVWIYGGKVAAQNGQFVRTVNDFSKAGGYVWRTETSVDGINWNPVRGGSVKAVPQAGDKY